MEAALDLACSQLRSEIHYLTDGEVRIVCCHSGKVWDAYTGKAFDRISQFPRHDQAHQRWRLVCVNVGLRLFEITSPYCGLLADVYHQETGRGVNLVLFHRNNGDHQRFVFEKTQREREYFIRAWHSNLHLDVQGSGQGNHAPIIQWELHGGANQRFRVERY